MTDTKTDAKLTRRQIAVVAAGGALVVGLAAAGATPADAYQGNMERAMSDMYDALASLKESTPNKGGHRERAIGLLNQAIAETQAGIVFADEHGGGGAQ